MGLSNLKNYSGVLQFTNRKDAPTDVDTRTKPVQVIFDDPSQALVTIDNIVPTGSKPGEFSFSCVTTDGAIGGFSGKFVADPDMTEAGEGSLEIPFAEVVGAEEATGASVSFGAGTDK